MPDDDAARSGDDGAVAPSPSTSDDVGGRAEQVPQARITEASRTDSGDVIALWHNAGLTRPVSTP